MRIGRGLYNYTSGIYRFRYSITYGDRMLQAENVNIEHIRRPKATSNVDAQ